LKAIILAAGKGTRMLPLTETRPKPLVHVCGKPFLYYLLENIRKAGFKEIGIVAGYKIEKIKEFLKEYEIDATVIKQPKQLGTGHATLWAEKFVDKDDFIVLMGDNLYSTDDIKAVGESEANFAIGAMEHKEPQKYGCLVTEAGFLKEIVEKPERKVSNLINVALYKFSAEIFKVLKKIPKSARGEYEVTDAISEMCAKERFKVHRIEGYWLDFGYPWDILSVNEFLVKRLPNRIMGDMSEKANIMGNVYIEEGATVKAGSFIVGPVYIGTGCEIGPNCLIRNYTSLSKGVKVGSASEVKNSVVMPKSKIPHHNYVGDSIIGENCNFGSGTKVANLRHDGKNVRITVNTKRMDSGRKKFGCIMGDNVRTGINASIMPGVKIGSNAMIYPSVVVYKDVKEGERRK